MSELTLFHVSNEMTSYGIRERNLDRPCRLNITWMNWTMLKLNTFFHLILPWRQPVPGSTHLGVFRHVWHQYPNKFGIVPFDCQIDPFGSELIEKWIIFKYWKIVFTSIFSCSSDCPIASFGRRAVVANLKQQQNDPIAKDNVLYEKTCPLKRHWHHISNGNLNSQILIHRLYM